MEFFEIFLFKLYRKKEEEKNKRFIYFVYYYSVPFSIFIRKIISNTPRFWNRNWMWRNCSNWIIRYTRIFVTWSRSTGDLLSFLKINRRGYWIGNAECINIIRYIRDINSNSGISRERLLFANWFLFGITNVRKIVTVLEYCGNTSRVKIQLIRIDRGCS